MKRVLFASLILLAVLAACGGTQGADISVSDAWSRESPAMAHAGAVYMTLTNDGREDDALVGARSDVCETVELHESIMENDVMKMQPVEGGRIVVPAGASVELKPGGLHVMLIGMKQTMTPGDTFTLELEFEQSGAMELEVEIRDAGEMGMGG